MSFAPNSGSQETCDLQSTDKHPGNPVNHSDFDNNMKLAGTIAKFKCKIFIICFTVSCFQMFAWNISSQTNETSHKVLILLND